MSAEFEKKKKSKAREATILLLKQANSEFINTFTK